MYALTESDYLQYKKLLAKKDADSNDDDGGEEDKGDVVASKSITAAADNDDINSHTKLKVYANKLYRERFLRDNASTTLRSGILSDVMKAEKKSEETPLEIIKSAVEKFPLKMRTKALRLLQFLEASNITFNKQLNVVKPDGEVLSPQSNILDLIYHSVSAGPSINEPATYSDFINYLDSIPEIPKHVYSDKQTPFKFAAATAAATTTPATPTFHKKRVTTLRHKKPRTSQTVATWDHFD